MEKQRRYPLHVLIASLFGALVLTVGGLLGGIAYVAHCRMLERDAQDLVTRIGRGTVRDFSALVTPAELAVQMFSQGMISKTRTHGERLPFLGAMQTALNVSHELAAVYAGFSNGDFFLLRRLADAQDRAFFSAPEGAAYLVQSIAEENGTRQGRYLFLDARLQLLREEHHPDYAATYDPRQRAWYEAALSQDGQVKTPPYVFYTTRRPGITLANRAPGGHAVIAADVRVEVLNQRLEQQRVTPGALSALTNFKGEVIAFHDGAHFERSNQEKGRISLTLLGDLDDPVFSLVAKQPDWLDPSQSRSWKFRVGREDWRVYAEPFIIEGTQPPLFLVTAIPDSELLASARSMLRNTGWAVLFILGLSIPVTLALARSVSNSLRQLNREAESIRRFEFERRVRADSFIVEVSELAHTMDEMKGTIRHFLDVSQRVAAENDFDRLLPRLLEETMAAAKASLGVLYLADEEALKAAAALGADGELPLPEKTLIPARRARDEWRVAFAANEPTSLRLNSELVAALGLSALPGLERLNHVIVVPLRNREQHCVGGVLLLREGETNRNRLGFIGALSTSSSLSLEAKELLQAQKRLFESMILMIAGAIDAKSPYTAGHCARVPEIAERLAKAACASQEGAFADFSLNAAEREALHIAAWMHDCGKLTTPEYVVDKATKLETIYDRLHEIRMRFEVLKRDAEIVCLKAIAAGTPAAEAEAALASAWAQLDEDFAFVAGCNEGGEFMAPEKLERLQRIGARTWQRTLDDRIGLGHEERARKARQPAPALPATETLLADKPEHRILRETKDPARNPGAHGIRMDVPELSYNLGELYNLSVARGTLTAEERYKINEHSIQTIFMLERLPFPRHLRQVPEIAANHHEKLDGTGYPRRLSGEQLCLLARIMAIADVFEALTAVDRPYKKGKTLSEALRIMAMLRDQRHIDADLFALFVRSGVYLDYAHQFMRPEQIDVVDVEAVLA